jgi:hypothetical protein
LGNSLCRLFTHFKLQGSCSVDCDGNILAKPVGGKIWRGVLWLRDIYSFCINQKCIGDKTVSMSHNTELCDQYRPLAERVMFGKINGFDG